jgi:PAS domain S-box-containing protein
LRVVLSAEALAHSRRIGEAIGPMFDAARVPIFVVRPDGRFAAVNEVALRQYDYTLDEFLEMRVHDLILDPRDVDGDLRLVGEGAWDLERRRHRKKGGSVLWVLPMASPMTLLGERYVVSIPQDVTAVVEAEARAKKDEQRAEDLWHAASEQLTDGIALISRDYRIVKINSALARMLRRSPAEILGKTCREVFPSCRERPCMHEIAASENRRLVLEFQSLIDLLPLRIEIIPCAPISSDDEDTFALINIAHDQTQERAFRSELISADRLATMGRLAAGVAHEVNNPAALVTVNLGVLRDRLAAGTARPGDMLTILDESLDGMRRIHEMVRDLKGFARERARESVDLGELARSAVRMAAHATRGHARVTLNLDRDVHATVRSARVAQVVLNLIINAAEAIPPGRQNENSIGIRIWKEGGLAHVEVSDSGPGVPPELAPHIFEPFFTTREKHGGTGLGLWLAREIVEEEGGRIVLCESDRRDRGARFLVTLTASPLEATSRSDGAHAPRPPLG